MAAGDWFGGYFGAFVAALLSIPCAAALQVIVREAWRAAAPGGIAPVDTTRATIAFTLAESRDGLSWAASPLQPRRRGYCFGECL